MDRSGQALGLLALTGLQLFAGGALSAAINRCDGLDGVTVYTDQRCHDLGFKELPIPRSRPGRVAPPILINGCAAQSPELMRGAVDAAISRRDFNALSALYNFDGRSSRSAAPVIRRLERMAKRTVLEINLVEIALPDPFELPPWPPLPAVMPELRIVQFGQGSSGPLSIETFAMTRSAGCLWLAR